MEREAIAKLAERVFRASRNEPTDVDLVETMLVSALLGEPTAQDEIEHLRIRLRDTEDALRREVRKNMKSATA